MTSDGEGKLADLLAQAKEQLASLTEELHRGVKSASDPAQRRKLATESIDLVQRGLSLAQDGLDKLRERATQDGHSEPETVVDRESD